MGVGEAARSLLVVAAGAVRSFRPLSSRCPLPAWAWASVPSVRERAGERGEGQGGGGPLTRLERG